MKTSQQDTISHFSHPGHELVKKHYVGPFLCDMCWKDLTTGPAYGCRAGCDFAIHDTCAGHPQTLSSPAHHAHPLALLQISRDATFQFQCDVCAGNCAPGSFLYRCPPCGFDMHPSCAHLPPVVRSARHMEHDLTLVQSEGQCAACHLSGAWFYRCTVCRDLDFHVSCAAALPGQQQDGEARGGENQQYGDGGAHHDDEAELLAVTRDFEAELLHNRMLVQMHTATAASIANMGFSISRLA